MKKKLPVPAALAACLAGLLVPAYGTSKPPAFTEEPVVTANPNPAVPLAAIVRFAASEPVSTSIQVTDGKHTWALNYGASRNPEDGLPVLGMRPNRKHEIRVSIRNAAGEVTRAPKTLEFTTPPLPSAASSRRIWMFEQTLTE